MLWNSKREPNGSLFLFLSCNYVLYLYFFSYFKCI
nr:MAG TPA_asm: DNA binding protein [Caudoviricetes sp.]